MVPGLYKHIYLAEPSIYTYTLRDVTSTIPVGFALNRNDDKAIAARRAIMHDERNADKLFMREIVVCILATSR